MNLKGARVIVTGAASSSGYKIASFIKTAGLSLNNAAGQLKPAEIAYLVVNLLSTNNKTSPVWITNPWRV